MMLLVLLSARDRELRFDILSLGTIVLPSVDRAPVLLLLSSFFS